MGLVGVDEVGRGCLAGPVFAAAVLIDDAALEELLRVTVIRDSKQMSAKQREQAAVEILRLARVGMGRVEASAIDEINILQATFVAMREAIAALEVSGDVHVFVDGNQRIPDLPFPQTTVIHGDAINPRIAAASIVAKVARDALLQGELHERYPMYGFSRHKGYGTAVHRAAIQQFGLTPEHRKTFCKSLPVL